MNEKKSKSRYKYPIVAFVITIVAGLIAISLSPATTTTVSAAATNPVDPDIKLVEIHLLGVKSTSAEDVKFTGPNFAQTYTIKNDQTLTGVKVGIKMKYGQEIPSLYQASVKITDPSGNVALDIPRDSEDWNIDEWQYDMLIISHDADLTFTEEGTWTIQVELWYYT